MFSHTSKIRSLAVTLAAAFVVGLAASSAFAQPIQKSDPVQNYWNCRAAGGTPKACCAGVGGTYSEFTDATGQRYAKCVITVSQSVTEGSGNPVLLRPPVTAVGATTG